MNLIDQAIRVFSPSRAVERERARAQLAVLNGLGAAGLLDAQALAGDGGVGGGGVGRSLRRWSGMGLDARADTLPHLPLQRAESRALARSNAIAGSAINTNVQRVVGTGLALSAQPAVAVLGWTPERAQRWKAKVQAEFSLWADSTACDWTGEQNFFELQGLVMRAVLESGDCFSLLPQVGPSADMPHGLRVQVLEGDRVGNPLGVLDSADMAGGIRFGNGRPVAAHIYDRHPGAVVLQGKRLAGHEEALVGDSGRRRLLHHFRKLRPEQPRGIPYIAPIIEQLKQIGRYTDAEIAAAVISAYFTVFIETEGGHPAPVFEGAGDGVGDGSALDPIELGVGAVVGLNKGEKPHFANPNRPNPNFDGFVLAVMRQIGMALGLPHELLMKQFNSSYSASKAALLDAWIYFRDVRTWLARSFCQPVYETWLAEAVASGRIEAPGFFRDPLLRWAYTRALWPGDSMGSINPKDEVAAYSAAIDARLVTRERAEWELFGTDFHETFAQKRAEHELLRDADMLPAPKPGAAAAAAPVRTEKQDETD